MSILIKGLAMPDCCWNCPCCDGEYGECNISGEKIKIADVRLTDCPLIKLPNHGDLIDREELSAAMYHEAFETDSNMQKWDSGCWIRYKMFENKMNETPVIIPAERSEDDKTEN